LKQVEYDHARNRDAHTVTGARTAIRAVFGDQLPQSLLDVGCGWGTWLRAAIDLGVADVLGVDGGAIFREDFLCSYELFHSQDLCQPWDLRRRFDVALCLEVAEHLPSDVAPVLIEAITKHSDVIVFSAAAPGQPGQHHVNCQWPEYWQRIFNEYGYACDDSVRWLIWNNREIEPWYRQNIFVATRSIDLASREERIRPVLHPDMLGEAFLSERAKYKSELESGILPVSWYLSLPHRAVSAKLKHKLFRVRTRGTGQQ